MTCKIIRLLNPAGLLDPAVRELFTAAFAASPEDPDAFIRHPESFVDMVARPKQAAVFLGLEENGLGWLFNALAIVFLPSDPITPHPQVFHFFSRGSAALRHALVQELLAFCKSQGYTQIWAVNSTGKDDDVWLKTLRKAGTPKRVGTLFAFEVK
jgi:hypothetical protein